MSLQHNPLSGLSLNLLVSEGPPLGANNWLPDAIFVTFERRAVSFLKDASLSKTTCDTTNRRLDLRSPSHLGDLVLNPRQRHERYWRHLTCNQLMANHAAVVEPMHPCRFWVSSDLGETIDLLGGANDDSKACNVCLCVCVSRTPILIISGVRWSSSRFVHTVMPSPWVFVIGVLERECRCWHFWVEMASASADRLEKITM